MKLSFNNRVRRFAAWWGKPVRQHVSMRRYSTFHIGGKADLFVTIRCEDDLVLAVQGAVKFQIPFVIIGMGTNILVSDEGFRGLVIRNYSRRGPVVDGTRIWAPTGIPLARVVETALRHKLTGMEFATGIPGTVGGALYINAGAFGSSISEVVDLGKVIAPDGEIRVLKNREYRFGYRTSRLKSTKEVALGVWLNLSRGNPEEISRRMEEIRALRAQKHPERASYNAGSYFKNLPPKEKNGRREAAGKYLELAGAKEERRGGASVYYGHANFIVNEGRAKAQDVLELAEHMKKLVFDKFNIRLEEEVRFLDAEKGFRIGG